MYFYKTLLKKKTVKQHLGFSKAKLVDVQKDFCLFPFSLWTHFEENEKLKAIVLTGNEDIDDLIVKFVKALPF